MSESQMNSSVGIWIQMVELSGKQVRMVSKSDLRAKMGKFVFISFRNHNGRKFLFAPQRSEKDNPLKAKILKYLC